MKVSLITPTFQRERFHARILKCFDWQTHPDIEWLILDDSPAPSPLLATRNRPNIRYFHVPNRMLIGDKRNWLAEQCSGELIAHFDDDDFYAPNYVAEMVSSLSEQKLDFINLRGWFIYDKRVSFFGYWDLVQKTGLHFLCAREGVSSVDIQDPNYLGDNEIGWGFGYMYRKSLWQAIRFPSQDWNEDGVFSRAAHQHFRAGGKMDTVGICIHEIHGGNSSRSFPQYRVPSFMLKQIFPGYVEAAAG